jgi:hypothetical protein
MLTRRIYTMRRLVVATIITLTLFTLGCAKKISVHPGAISNFDSYAYDVLLVEQDVLNQAKADVISGTLPASTKDKVNVAIAQYNTTQALWQTYHASGVGADKLDQALALLVTAVGEIQKLRGKAPALMPAHATWPSRLEPVTLGGVA